MKPCRRCGHTFMAHCHDHGHYQHATWCAYWDRCGCDKYRRRWSFRRRKDTR